MVAFLMGEHAKPAKRPTRRGRLAFILDGKAAGDGIDSQNCRVKVAESRPKEDGAGILGCVSDGRACEARQASTRRDRLACVLNCKAAVDGIDSQCYRVR